LSRGDWSIFFRSGITWFFWALTVLTIIMFAYQSFRGRSGPSASGPQSVSQSVRGSIE